MTRVSVIIPTLNEVGCLERTLRCLSWLNPPPWEVLVVDGGSQDDTVAIVQSISQSTSQSTHPSTDSYPALFTNPSPKITLSQTASAGRAIQMNHGAALATGEILCFLHADTLVPDDLVQVIINTLKDKTIACGGFISLMTGEHQTRWGISLHNFLKTYYAPFLFRPHLFFLRGLRLLFGDQVMFCRRQDFWHCGGFDPTLPIMEEADLCLKLTQVGRIRQVNRVVQSSDRRVAQWGALKATAIYLMIGCLWGMGVSALRLKQFYDDVR